MPSSSEWSGGRGATALPVIRGFALALGDDAAKMAALHKVATSCDPPGRGGVPSPPAARTLTGKAAFQAAGPFAARVRRLQ